MPTNTTHLRRNRGQGKICIRQNVTSFKNEGFDCKMNGTELIFYLKIFFDMEDVLLMPMLTMDNFRKKFNTNISCLNNHICCF